MLSVSHIVVEEFWPTLLYNLTSVYWGFSGVNFCTALLRSQQSISIRLMSGLWPDRCNIVFLFFFSHSIEDLLLCLGSLYCCMAKHWKSFGLHKDGLTFYSRIVLYTEKLNVDLNDCKMSRSCGSNQVQVISPPSQSLTVFLMICCVWFSPSFVRYITTLFQKICACFKPKPCWHVDFREENLQILPNKHTCWFFF